MNPLAHPVTLKVPHTMPELLPELLATRFSAGIVPTEVDTETSIFPHFTNWDGADSGVAVPIVSRTKSVVHSIKPSETSVSQIVSGRSLAW